VSTRCRAVSPAAAGILASTSLRLRSDARRPADPSTYTGQHRQHGAAGLDLARTHPAIEAYKDGIDRTLLRENLRLTPDQRVEKMIAALRFAEAVKESRLRARQ
jgi:hypothetical protein